MKKRIGIVCSKNGEGGLGIPSAYSQYFAQYGILIPINALDDQLDASLDLLVLQGGADVMPQRYGAELSYYCQNPNLQMEWWDLNVLPLYINAEIPIFGVCRGFQSLNVHFGGTLNQHIAQETSVRRDELIHDLIFTEEAAVWNRNHNNFLDMRTGKGGVAFKVNSLHHQGFNISQCGTGVIPILKHSFRTNVEAFIMSDAAIAGVQWHPEEIWDTYSYHIINGLLNDRF